jgi:hypothetical protein
MRFTGGEFAAVCQLERRGGGGGGEGVPAIGAIQHALLAGLFVDALATSAHEHERHLHGAAHIHLQRGVKKATGSRVTVPRLLEIHVLHDALARGALALGARERGVLARVLQDLKAAALPLVLVEAPAPNGRIARGDAFPTVADELQALAQMA